MTFRTFRPPRKNSFFPGMEPQHDDICKGSDEEAEEEEKWRQE